MDAGFYDFVKDACDDYIEAENIVQLSVVETRTVLNADKEEERRQKPPIWMKKLEADFGWKITSQFTYPTVEKTGRYGDVLRDLAIAGALSKDVLCTVEDVFVRSLSPLGQNWNDYRPNANNKEVK